MLGRCIISLTLTILASLLLVAPVQAGGWAVVTLDSLPRDVRAGDNIQIGFVVRQHGRTPTNQDLNGKPLKPVLVASKLDTTAANNEGRTHLRIVARASDGAKGEEQIRVEARQEGTTGHYLADIAFPSDGVWAWQIEVPTYYVQSDGNGSQGDAAVFEPLSVLPAVISSAQSDQASFPSFSWVVLRWIGLILILFAAGIALYAWQARFRSRPTARSL